MAFTSAKVFHCSTLLGAFRPPETGQFQNDSLSASQNDYALGSSDTIQQLIATSALNITGIVAPAAVAVRILENTGQNTITLKHADAGSAAANRFLCPGSADFALAAGAFIPIFYDVAGSRWIVSTVAPRSSFKMEVDATDGAVVMLSKAFWSLQNTGLDNAGAAITGPVYYRYGLAVPTASYAVNTAATRESIPILNGVDEVIQIKRGDFGVFLKSASGTAVMLFRSNESGLGFNR